MINMLMSEKLRRQSCFFKFTFVGDKRANYHTKYADINYRKVFRCVWEVSGRHELNYHNNKGVKEGTQQGKHTKNHYHSGIFCMGVCVPRVTTYRKTHVLYHQRTNQTKVMIVCACAARCRYYVTLNKYNIKAFLWLSSYFWWLPEGTRVGDGKTYKNINMKRKIHVTNDRIKKGSHCL